MGKEMEDSTSDEEPLFITRLLEWWSTEKPCQEKFDYGRTTGAVQIPNESGALTKGGLAQDKRMPREGSEVQLPPQPCLLADKLKTARGFGLTGESRPWICSQFSSHGHNGCWRCRHSTNGQENFLKFFQEREREVRRQHEASTGVLLSSDNISWREQLSSDHLPSYGENISWREQVGLPSSCTAPFHSNSSGENSAAELKNEVAAEDHLSPISATPPKLIKTATKVKSKKYVLFWKLKHWRPNLPVIIEEEWESKEDDFSKSVSLNEKMIQLKKEIHSARAKNLSLKILNLIIVRLSEFTEKHVDSPSPLNSHAEEWKQSCPSRRLKERSTNGGPLSPAGGKNTFVSTSSIRSQFKTTLPSLIDIQPVPVVYPCDLM